MAKGWFRLNSWAIVLLSAMFFFYGFFQTNMMSVLSESLMQEFKVTSAEIGFISALLFYANIIFMLPAGVVLDRFSVRKIVTITGLIAVLGTLIFAFAPSIGFVAFGRFLTGIMTTFALLACLKIAASLLPPSKMALASSLIITIGMVGAIFSQTPLRSLISHLGWRPSLVVVANFGVLVSILLYFIVKIPKKDEAKVTEESHLKRGIIDGLRLVVRDKQNWFCGLFTTFVNLPVAILGALFGVNYLKQAYGMSDLNAASASSMLFLGMILGSPAFGWISDYLKLRKRPMFIGSILCLIFSCFLIYSPNIPFWMIYSLMFLIGFTSAAQVLGYPTISESNSPKLVATALALGSILILGIGYGLGLPIAGKLLDLSWNGVVIDDMPFYSVASYRIAFSMIPIGIILGIISCALIKETRCEHISHKK